MPYLTDAYVVKLEELMGPIKEALINGSCKSYEEYKENCGVLRGLAMAVRDFKQLLKNVEED